MTRGGMTAWIELFVQVPTSIQFFILGNCKCCCVYRIGARFIGSRLRMCCPTSIFAPSIRASIYEGLLHTSLHKLRRLVLRRLASTYFVRFFYLSVSLPCLVSLYDFPLLTHICETFMLYYQLWPRIAEFCSFLLVSVQMCSVLTDFAKNALVFRRWGSIWIFFMLSYSILP